MLFLYKPYYLLSEGQPTDEGRRTALEEEEERKKEEEKKKKKKKKKEEEKKKRFIKKRRRRERRECMRWLMSWIKRIKKRNAVLEVN